jgi:hypothetical protein
VKKLGVNPTGVFHMEALVSDKNRVFAKFEAAVDVNLATVKEVENLGDHEGVGEAKTDEGRVAEEGGTD